MNKFLNNKIISFLNNLIYRIFHFKFLITFNYSTSIFDNLKHWYYHTICFRT